MAKIRIEFDFDNKTRECSNFREFGNKEEYFEITTLELNHLEDAIQKSLKEFRATSVLGFQ